MIWARVLKRERSLNRSPDSLSITAERENNSRATNFPGARGGSSRKSANFIFDRMPTVAGTSASGANQLSKKLFRNHSGTINALCGAKHRLLGNLLSIRPRRLRLVSRRWPFSKNGCAILGTVRAYRRTVTYISSLVLKDLGEMFS